MSKRRPKRKRLASHLGEDKKRYAQHHPKPSFWEKARMPPAADVRKRLAARDAVLAEEWLKLHPEKRAQREAQVAARPAKAPRWEPGPYQWRGPSGWQELGEAERWLEGRLHSDRDTWLQSDWERCKANVAKEEQRRLAKASQYEALGV